VYRTLINFSSARTRRQGQLNRPRPSPDLCSSSLSSLTRTPSISAKLLRQSVGWGLIFGYSALGKIPKGPNLRSALLFFPSCFPGEFSVTFPPASPVGGAILTPIYRMGRFPATLYCLLLPCIDGQHLLWARPRGAHQTHPQLGRDPSWSDGPPDLLLLATENSFLPTSPRGGLGRRSLVKPYPPALPSPGVPPWPLRLPVGRLLFSRVLGDTLEAPSTCPARRAIIPAESSLSAITHLGSGRDPRAPKVVDEKCSGALALRGGPSNLGRAGVAAFQNRQCDGWFSLRGTLLCGSGCPSRVRRHPCRLCN